MGTQPRSRSIRTFSLPCGLALLLAVGLGDVKATAGTINLVSQQRYVDVNTDGIPNLTPQDQRADSPDFGPFDQSVTIDLTPDAAETASQSSSLTVSPDGSGAVFVADGSIGHQSVSVSGLPASSYFQVIFDVTSAIPYSLSYDGFVSIGNGRYGDDPLPGSFTGPTAPGDLAPPAPYVDPIELDGILQPGSYQLLVSGTGDGSNFGLNLQLGAAAVPLPAAFWAALSAVPMLLLGSVLLRRI